MEPTALQYRAQTSHAGYRRIDDVLLLMGHLQNALIRHRNCATSSHRRHWNHKLQNAHLTNLHRHQPEFNTCARRLLEGTTRRVNKAFDQFFNDPDAGKPTTKSPYRNDTLEISEPRVQHLKPSKPGWATIHIKGLPTIRFRTDRRLPTDTQPKVIQITRKPKGIVVSLTFQHEPPQIAEPTKDSAGIDPGRKHLITVKSDDGSILQVPGIDDSAHQKTKRRLRRKMQRQRDAALRDGRARFISQKSQHGTKRRFRWIGRPSKGYLKTLAQLRRVEQTRRESLRGFQHRLSTQIVRDHQIICMEDTKTRNLTRSAKGTVEQPGKNVAQKRALNRGILAQGWYGLRQKTEYKARWYGRGFVPVPAAYTSQRCSNCGHTEAGNRPRQEAFKCLACGHPDNADANAAENIRREGLLILARAGNLPGRAAGDPTGQQAQHDPPQAEMRCTHELALSTGQ